MAEKDSNTIIADRSVGEKIAEYVTKPGENGEAVISQAFITDDGKLASPTELMKMASRQSMQTIAALQGKTIDEHQAEIEEATLKTERSKYIEGSTQQTQEVNVAAIESDISGYPIVEPPYSPEILARFLEVDETHFRCVKTKVTDAVGREWDVIPATMPSGQSFDATKINQKVRSQIDSEILAVRQFIEECNDVLGFEGVLERAGMDYEGIGYGAIEIIRSRDMKIARIDHVPASRLRVIRGWRGFVEMRPSQQLMYYQPFGQKIVSKNRKDPITGKPSYYNPRLDGVITAGTHDWNMIDRETGKPTTDFNKSANEILWIPKHHPNTIYYGLTDVIPALGHLLANIHIRDFFLQFFEHNAVPQYAVIVEGAKLADPVKETIMKFFANDVKGSAHKTLIIPVPSAGGEVKVRFEKLNADTKEGSFQATRKNNTQGIMTAHGVSPAIIGIAEAANLGSGKGLSQAEIYKDRIVTPSQKRWERVLGNMFRMGLGVTMVKLHFDPLDIRDLEAEMRVWQGYSLMGAVTVNEIRKNAKIGDPIKGGDKAFIKAGPAGVMMMDSMGDNVDAIIEKATQEVSQIRQKMVGDGSN